MLKVPALLVLALFCFASSAKENRAAENEWLPYFIMMSGAGPAPLTFTPAALIGVCVGALMLIGLLDGSGPQCKEL